MSKPWLSVIVPTCNGAAYLDKALASIAIQADDGVEVIAVDDALQELERHDPRKAKLVVMRFFGGLTAEESAEVLQLPVQTVRRELRLAQAWLQRELDRR